MKKTNIAKIAIFASGSGSNAENIIRYFEKNDSVKIVSIVANKADAYVHERARDLNIPSYTFSKSEFENGEVLKLMEKQEIDWIVLAGFLLKISKNLLEAYPNKIINIHPALLPKYGGKGMYGSQVHEAVVANRETESGITIHYVNENYDEGAIIFQTQCEISPNDSAEDVAAKVHELEYRWFPEVIEKLFF